MHIFSAKIKLDIVCELSVCHILFSLKIMMKSIMLSATLLLST